MAKSFVSPGVYAQETDASFLGPGVGTIGAAILGTAAKGPAFVPVTVSDYPEFASFFGDLDPDHLSGYAARAYLKNAGTLNFVRVLGPEGRIANGSAVTAGYSAETLWSINGQSGSTNTALATLEITGSAALVITDLTNDEFFIRITGSSLPHPTTDGFVAVTASFLSGSSNFIKKVLNTDPTLFSQQGYYLRDVYDYGVKLLAVGNANFNSSSHAVVTNFAFGYNSGSTPWIKSQLFGGLTDYNLFRLHTLGHGEAENGRFKISIRNIRVSPAPTVTEYGRFDLEVRDFGDTDRNPSVIESFPNLTFDPVDPNYIARAIGDKMFMYDNNRSKMVESGDYENRSKYFRIEMTTGSFPATSLPWGFKGLAKPNLASGTLASLIKDLPYVADNKDKETQSEAQTFVYWGMETELSGNVKSRFSRYSAMTGSDADFALTFVSGNAVTSLRYDTTVPAAAKKSPGDTLSFTILDPSNAQFTVPVAFGFDGFDRRLTNPLANESQLAGITQLGTQALRQAVDIVGDADYIDINILAIPGIYSSKVTDYASQKVVARGDCFYVMDVSGSSVNAVVQEVKGRGFDNNYSAVYYPSIRVNDDVNGRAVTIPASIPVLGVLAFTDRVAQPWFAPAGLNRAGLSRDTIGFDVASIVDQLTQTERDKLYENRINPIARFPDVPQGVIWGQKTLQLKSSALDRVNVRRLLIKAKKLIATAVKFLVFEPNNPQTRTRFLQLVNPILAEIQQKQGLEAFKVVIDDTNNTPADIDRNTMNAKLMLVPTRSTEILNLNFVVGKSGVTFDE
jgi:hypothetical protein